MGIVLQQTVQNLLRRKPFGQQVEAARTERDVGQGLRGHRADTAAGPRDDRAGRQELGLHGHADFVRFAVDGDDREGHLRYRRLRSSHSSG